MCGDCGQCLDVLQSCDGVLWIIETHIEELHTSHQRKSHPTQPTGCGHYRRGEVSVLSISLPSLYHTAMGTPALHLVAGRHAILEICLEPDHYGPSARHLLRQSENIERLQTIILP